MIGNKPDSPHRHEKIDMNPVPESPAGRYMVVAAWHCRSCDVQGRSPTDTEVRCWNCDGPVTITAQPSIPIDELGPISPHVVPQPRPEPQMAASQPGTRSGPAPSPSVPQPRPAG